MALLRAAAEEERSDALSSLLVLVFLVLRKL